MTEIPKAPRGLARRGRAYWRSVLGSYELTDSETLVLEEACRVLDRLDMLDDAIRNTGAMVTGSQGQPVTNGLLTEARGQQLVLARLVGVLALPDDEDGSSVPTLTAASARAREARKRQQVAR
ncbi:hypothetical protein [Demequina rhizosphaerae]|uniref:hypothetical protein n=1 Tax=Demequina rhizosphaerae TaxID=1638985 RepID=UPI0007803501|nr:hypothetical protein [Demequina rhizosphaerae]